MSPAAGFGRLSRIFKDNQPVYLTKETHSHGHLRPAASLRRVCTCPRRAMGAEVASSHAGQPGMGMKPSCLAWLPGCLHACLLLFLNPTYELPLPTERPPGCIRPGLG